jgi:hypothetical protein
VSQKSVVSQVAANSENAISSPYVLIQPAKPISVPTYRVKNTPSSASIGSVAVVCSARATVGRRGAGIRSAHTAITAQNAAPPSAVTPSPR